MTRRIRALTIFVVVVVASRTLSARAVHVLDELPEHLLVDILFRVPDSVMLTQAARSSRALHQAASGPVAFHRALGAHDPVGLVRGLTDQVRDRPETLFFPEFPSDLPASVHDGIHEAASAIVTSCTDLGGPIANLYPEPLRAVFPRHRELAALLLARLDDKRPLACETVLRKLHRFGVAFDAAEFLDAVDVAADALPIVYPLLRGSAPRSATFLSELRVLLRHAALDKVRTILLLPEFYLRAVAADAPALVDFLIEAMSADSGTADRALVLDLPYLPAIVNVVGPTSRISLLHFAFRDRHMRLAERLLDVTGADPGLLDCEGRSAARFLAPDAADVALFLTLPAPHVDAVVRADPAGFLTVLLLALILNNCDAVQLGLRVPAVADHINTRLDVASLQSVTLLQVAFRYGRFQVVPPMLATPAIELEDAAAGRSVIADLDSFAISQFVALLPQWPRLADCLRRHPVEFVGRLSDALRFGLEKVVLAVMAEPWFADLVPVTFNGRTLAQDARRYHCLEVSRALKRVADRRRSGPGPARPALFSV